MVSLLVADDHPLFREALQAVILGGLADCQLYEADSLMAALAMAEQLPDLDLLLLDLSLPDAQGLEGLQQVREQHPGLAVAIISASQTRQHVLDALALGAVGYIPKSTSRDTLLNALEQILGGQIYLPSDIMRRPNHDTSPVSETPSPAINSPVLQLTDKQLDVLFYMGHGSSNKEIARELSIAETTVKTHVSAILRKLGATSRVHAVVLASQTDLESLRQQRRQQHAQS